MNKQQAIIFFGIILAGLGVSLVSLKYFGDRLPDPEDSAQEETAPAGRGVAASPDPALPTESAPPPLPEPPVPEPPAAASHAAPETLVSALAARIAEGDLEGFLGLVEEGAISPEIRPQVEGLLRSQAWKPRAEEPLAQVARDADYIRWAIHLERPPAPGVPGAAVELYADVAAAPEDSPRTGWIVRKIALPLDFAEKTGLTPAATVAMRPGETPAPGIGSAPDGAAVPRIAPAAAADALSVALAFSQALLEQDFEQARRFTDPEAVTLERVAALMISLEEGGFQLREDKPLIVTLSRDDLTWVITRVDAASLDSEFAVELGRAGGDGDWRIHGITFSKLIAALAEEAGAGGVAYAPIVANPQGGDSLVLHFEFDEDRVSPRSSRQLRIVADILKQDPGRKIHINGHADALGTDNYNEALSDRRAAAIRRALVQHGAAPVQIETQAFGSAVPRRPNFNPDGTDNPDNRSLNRRAEVYLDF